MTYKTLRLVIFSNVGTLGNFISTISKVQASGITGRYIGYSYVPDEQRQLLVTTLSSSRCLKQNCFLLDMNKKDALDKSI
jgi:hypothetical protein